MPDLGNFAPSFTLPSVDASGQPGTCTLSALRPQSVVLFFYPRDATTSCTREAQEFSARAADFAALGVRLIGVSKDSIAAHRRFVQTNALQLTLVSDATSDLCERFGAWGAKTLYGRAYEGILRTTFLIDGAGRIAGLWRVARVAGHAEAVLAAVRGAAD